MITLAARLWLWSSEGANWHFISIPEELCGEIRAERLSRGSGFGSVRVEATINGLTWQTSVFPQKSGGFILPVKAEVRRRARIATGDEVTLALEIL